MGKLVNFITRLHKSTNRSYLTMKNGNGYLKHASIQEITNLFILNSKISLN